MNNSTKIRRVTSNLDYTVTTSLDLPLSITEKPLSEMDLALKRGAEKSLLGIKAKCSSPSTLNHSETTLDKSRKLRSERYNLSRVARGIYAAEGAREGLPYILNYHRTARCTYIAHSDVDIKKSNEHEKCFYTGVFTCGSVWTCSNCASKIQERRRVEIAHAMSSFYATGYMQAAMITFTFSHKFGDDIVSLLSKQAKALRLLRNGKAFEKFKDVFGFDSLIRSLEVTYGRNGYHPHTHELWFIDKVFDDAKIKDYLMAKFRAKKDHAYRDTLLKLPSREIFTALLLDRWQSSCEKVGLIGESIDVFRKHSLDVKFEVNDSDYLAKQDDSRHWGADREMAKATSKNGREKGMHPFMFLTKYEETGEGIWAVRWLEYTKAFHGKSQLYWSSRLKKRLGIKEITDLEIAARKDDEAETIYNVDMENEWLRVRNNPSFVLDVCEDTSDKNKIKSHIATISDKSTYERAAAEDEITKNPLREISELDALAINNDIKTYVIEPRLGQRICYKLPAFPLDFKYSFRFDDRRYKMDFIKIHSGYIVERTYYNPDYFERFHIK